MMNAMTMQNYASLGDALRAARSERRVSQLQLALDAGVSQRHVSYVETGRAQPSRELLMALCETLMLPFAKRNALLLLAGFAPLYSQPAYTSENLTQVRAALTQLLEAHEPSPAMVLDARWQLLQANHGLVCLLKAVAGEELAQKLLAQMATPEGVNMLQLMFNPQGLRPYVINFDEVAQSLLHHARAAQYEHPEVASLLESITPWLPRSTRTAHSPTKAQPVLYTRIRSQQHGELCFFSMFSTFGTPQDITTASLRVEHLFAADEATKAVLESWRNSS